MPTPLFEELHSFLLVVDAGSYSRAATRARVPKSTLSRSINRLEAELGVRLLQRNSRSMSLTAEGRNLAETARPHIEALLHSIEAAHSIVKPLSGTVRLTAPATFGSYMVAPILSRFLDQHPLVRIETMFVDRQVDLVEEAIDIAFRLGPQIDSDLIGKRVGAVRRVLCAAPSFISKHGPLNEPADLNGKDGLALNRQILRLCVSHPIRGRAVIELAPRLLSSPMNSLIPSLLDGIGIAGMPDFAVESHLRSGALQRLLPGWSVPDTDVTMVYPSSRGISRTVATMMAFAVEHLPQRHIEFLD